MFDFLDNLHSSDYSDTHKIVLAIFILFGTFILKLLIGQKERFIRNDRNILIVYFVFLVIFAGTRAKNIGVDTTNYYNYFYIPATQAGGFFEIFSRLKTDFLFEVLLSLTVWTNNYNVVLFSIAIVLNLSLYTFVRRFTNYGIDGSSLILFLTMASSFSFLNLEINIMRNALAFGFVLMSINYALEGNYKKCFMLLGIAFLFHRTTIILIFTIAAVIMTKRVPIKYYIALYFLAILISIAGLGFHSVSFLAELGNEDLKNLTFSGDTNYNVGFRPDFTAYNTFFLLLFVKFANKQSKKSIFLLKYYIITSVIFFFNFYIPFSDRFGLLSWIIIPLLLYNIVNEMFPEKKVFISTIVVISFFILNKIILFP
ncbi:MAG: EpsG family protein [Flavobacteriaceae bacterium]|nr:EpsG family protein [Flavobacteriaceae bacterium]